MRVKATATRTYNPLPFQDLEPKRFEDLVRQLAYDFRPWKSLEPTGRSGSDDGFDARGFERVAGDSTQADDHDEEGNGSDTDGTSELLWLIQCKREKVIASKKMRAYLDAIRLGPDEALHGVVFAAACDFSKATRDTFRAWCHERGIAEGHIWGRGELEDMLYQPKNDNLLFAYFGISLTIRKRALASQLRARVTIKRKLAKLAESSEPLLLRDPEAGHYPHPNDDELKKWWPYVPERLRHDGFEMLVRRHWAFYDPATHEWDMAEAIEVGQGHHIWLGDQDTRYQLASEIVAFHQALPEDQRAFFELYGIVDYDAIVAIDDLGDDCFEGAHIFVPFRGPRGPFTYLWAKLDRGKWIEDGELDEEKRVARFPEHLRKRRMS